jgi:hypothetical protein
MEGALKLVQRDACVGSSRWPMLHHRHADRARRFVGGAHRDRVDEYATRCDELYRAHVRLLAEVDACAGAIRADMSDLAAAAAALAVALPVLEGDVDEAEALVAWSVVRRLYSL